MSKTPKKVAVPGPVGKTSFERILLRLNKAWCDAVPQEARAGSFDVPADHDRFGERYDVPAGIYRVEGSDWLFTFEKNKLVNVSRAIATNGFGGDKVVTVSTQWLT